MNNLELSPATAISVVATDLDGSLLDKESYSYAAATPALQRLYQYGIPIILCTSKTAKEVEQLELPVPYVAAVLENGSFTQLANSTSTQAMLTSFSYAELCQFLDKLRSEHLFQFVGFHDLTPFEVTQLTGLSLKQAEAARHRLASEPIQWQGSDEDLNHFKQLLAEHKLQLVKGGRFLLVMPETSKAKALQTLLTQLWPETRPQVIALGDSDNDIPLLRHADIAIAIPHLDGTCLNLTDHPHFIQAPLPGAKGWRIAIEELLDNTL